MTKPRYGTAREMGAIFDGENTRYACTADQVIVEDRLPVDTGLVGPDGVKIYRVDEREPIGIDPRRWAVVGAEPEPRPIKKTRGAR